MSEQLRSHFGVPDEVFLGVNDIGWLRIFAHTDIQERIDNEGVAFISAREIKALSGREPRLMAKHDFSTSRPWIFATQGLSLLPISRDSYALGRFDLYKPFPSPGPLRSLPVPRGFESIDFDNLTSEANTLAAAGLAGILEDFLGDSRLRPTVSGRMSTQRFEVEVSQLERRLAIDRAQMELDAGLESPEHLVVVEAKHHLAPDFNIRQLYFPYRRFANQVSKPVIPLYLVYSNGIFHLHRYHFTRKEDFRSIEVVSSARYMLGESTIDVPALRAVLERTAAAPEPPIPFPQADSFARVISLCELLPASKEDIHVHYGFSPRQADYYLNAVNYLGLTAAQGTRDERNLQYLEALAKRKVFRRVIEFVADNLRAPSREEAAGMMCEARIELSHSTMERRAGTVVAWAQWVVELISPRQLSLL